MPGLLALTDKTLTPMVNILAQKGHASGRRLVFRVTDYLQAVPKLNGNPEHDKEAWEIWFAFEPARRGVDRLVKASNGLLRAHNVIAFITGCRELMDSFTGLSKEGILALATHWHLDLDPARWKTKVSWLTNGMLRVMVTWQPAGVLRGFGLSKTKASAKHGHCGVVWQASGSACVLDLGVAQKGSGLGIPGLAADDPLQLCLPLGHFVLPQQGWARTKLPLSCIERAVCSVGANALPPYRMRSSLPSRWSR